MKIGLIADIHGNQHALTKVLSQLYLERVDLILCAGDLVCYGSQTNQVLDLMRSCAIPCVTGNYDAAVAWNLPSASNKPSSPATEALKQTALDWAKRNVHSKHRDYLRGLPWMLSYYLDKLRIVVIHAGLQQLDEWYSPEEPAHLCQLAAQMAADVIVLGHTHQPFVCEVEYAPGRKTLFVNPGAVGRSLDGDTRSAYATLQTATRDVQLKRIEYDVKMAVQAIMNSGMPHEIGLLIQYGVRRVEQLPAECIQQVRTSGA
jgi:putative phosphoesterase